MPENWKNIKLGLAGTAVIGLLLAGCGDDPADDEAEEDQTDEEAAQDDQAANSEDEIDEEALEELEDMMGDPEDMPDPEEDIEDGVYRGNGVALPVPDGFSVDPTALQQGVVAATADDGEQQLTAQAIDTEQAEAAGQSLALDDVLDNVRQQVPEDADVDEEVDLAGADRAHRLTFLGLPGQQEDQPEASATILLAETDDLVGEFSYNASADGYDEDVASLLVNEAGFDPDSEPPEMPQAQPQPEGDGDELEDVDPED